MVRIHRKLDSDTLYLPELKPFIGCNVEITVEEQLPEVRDQFYAEAARLPQTQEDFDAQKEILRSWRSDSRFQTYWPLLDQLLARSFEHVQKWAAVTAAVGGLENYDFDAYQEQRRYDRQHAGDHVP